MRLVCFIIASPVHHPTLCDTRLFDIFFGNRNSRNWDNERLAKVACERVLRYRIVPQQSTRKTTQPKSRWVSKA
jgi:hypothetical protein